MLIAFIFLTAACNDAYSQEDENQILQRDNFNLNV